MTKVLFNFRKVMNLSLVIIVFAVTGSLFMDTLKSNEGLLTRLENQEVYVVKSADDYTPPLVTFIRDDLTYTNYAVGYEFEDVHTGDSLLVTLDPQNPNKIVSKESLNLSILNSKCFNIANALIAVFIIWNMSKYRYKHYLFDRQQRQEKYPKDLE